MSWHQVVEQANEEQIAVMSASSLVEEFGTALRQAGAPADAKLYVKKQIGKRTFLFNDAASKLSTPLLREHNAVPVSNPDLTGFKEIKV